MKLTIRANTPAQIVEEIRELAVKQAKIEEGVASSTHGVTEKRAMMAAGDLMRRFANMIGGITVELATDPRRLRAATMLEDARGLLGSEPDSGDLDSVRFFRESLRLIGDLREECPRRPVPNDLRAQMFLHCALCIEEIKAGASNSPRDYARLSVGWTSIGLQVWCVRHDCNVLHVDFEGCTHPADQSRKALADA